MGVNEEMHEEQAAPPASAVFKPADWRKLPKRSRGKPTSRGGSLGLARLVKLELMRFIERHPRLTANAKRVGCHIVWRYRETKGFAWPSAQTISKSLKINGICPQRACDRKWV